MKKRRIIYSIYLLLVVILELVVNSKISLLLLLTSLFLPLVSVLFCLFTRNKVTAVLEAPEELNWGDHGTVRVKFSNASPMPVANVVARVSLVNALTGTELEQEVHCSVPGKGQQSVSLKLEKAEVGQVFVTTSAVAVTDFFRLVGFNVADGMKKSILVYPKELSVTVDSVETMELTGDADRYSEVNPGHDVSRVFDIRDYFPGDDIRALHWKLSAKLDKEVVRTFSQQLNYSVIVLVELAATKSPALEATVIYASNLSRQFMAEGIPHTLAWYDKGREKYCSYNIAREADYEAAITGLICSVRNEDPYASLKSYLEREDRNEDAHLYYLTNSVADDLVLRTAMTYSMDIFLVGKRAKGDLLNHLSIYSLPGALQ